METNNTNENVTINETEESVGAVQNGTVTENATDVETDDMMEDKSGVAVAAGMLIVGIGAAGVVAAKKLIRKFMSEKTTEGETEEVPKEEKPYTVHRKLTLKERLTGTCDIQMDTPVVEMVTEEEKEA